MTAQRILKKTAKILAYTIGGAIVLLLALVVFLNTVMQKD